MSRKKKNPVGNTKENIGGLPPVIQQTELLSVDRNQDIANALSGYKTEAIQARRSGQNPRDPKWDQNIDLYNNRYDFTGKADWQAKETMPEVPAFVDRFASVLKEALVTVPEGFYTVSDPKDKEHDLTDTVKKLTDMWLDKSGRNVLGQPLDFSAVFEEQCKLGALMAMCANVSWKEDMPDGGRVAIDAVDPRFFWMDHTGRGLYRVRRVELDHIDLIKMAEKTDTAGNPIFDISQLQLAIQANPGSSEPFDEKSKKQALSGNLEEQPSDRHPFYLDEWVATCVDRQGNLIEGEHQLINTINDKFIVRGPEKNPYWHGLDWAVYAPLITVPLSPYGRSYMEDFGSLAKTYTEMTNLLLDAVHTTSLNAFAVVTEALENPEVLAGGIHPNILLKIDPAFDATKVFHSIQLGKLDQGGVAVWEIIKKSLSEAAGINEIGMGQFAPNSRTSATEVNETQSSSSAMARGTAQTVESRFLNPVLNLTWKTGMQFENFRNPEVIAALGEENAMMFQMRRKEFVKRPFTFRAAGISTLIRKKQVFQEIVQLMQVIGQNPQLAQLFMQTVDMNMFLRMLFYLSGIDPEKIGKTDRQQMIQGVVDPLQAAAGGVMPPQGPQGAMQ